MRKFFYFLISKYFWKHILLMLVAFVVLVFVLNWALKTYTKHGQKIPLPDYVGETLESAMEDAERRSFQIIPSDSVFIVGRRGGVILDQVPDAQQLVKEDRKIYVTITKFLPDLVRLEDMPPFYGRNYERTARVLEMAHSIDSEIVGRVYDPGPEGYIMGVVFEGDTVVDRTEMAENVEVPVGSKLGFIVSERRGGMVEIPNLVCRTFDEAEFIISSYKLRMGNTRTEGEISNMERAFVIQQDPVFYPSERIEMGSPIHLTLSATKPEHCDELEDN